MHFPGKQACKDTPKAGIDQPGVSLRDSHSHCDVESVEPFVALLRRVPARLQKASIPTHKEHSRVRKEERGPCNSAG